MERNYKILKDMKIYCITFILIIFIFTYSCTQPQTSDFFDGKWKANDGATVILKSDGTVEINQINWADVFFDFHNRTVNNVDLKGTWKFTTDLNGHKVININTGECSFDFNIKGLGIFENKPPWNLFIYIGDPDDVNRYEFFKQEN